MFGPTPPSSFAVARLAVHRADTYAWFSQLGAWSAAVSCEVCSAWLYAWLWPASPPLSERLLIVSTSFSAASSEAAVVSFFCSGLIEPKKESARWSSPWSSMPPSLPLPLLASCDAGIARGPRSSSSCLSSEAPSGKSSNAGPRTLEYAAFSSSIFASFNQRMSWPLLPPSLSLPAGVVSSSVPKRPLSELKYLSASSKAAFSSFCAGLTPPSHSSARRSSPWSPTPPIAYDAAKVSGGRSAMGCPLPGGAASSRWLGLSTVSYTHLTLPTICSV